ncbi:unnamed protein product [Effrenium voratum]|uniref:Uncharacterized protein n=1 Tax=Effrenium voratum TaxID=2562239 RepID=A0AA36JRN8_9DINO|nr:unnamed protein product [Effrenium voratum]
MDVAMGWGRLSFRWAIELSQFRLLRLLRLVRVLRLLRVVRFCADLRIMVNGIAAPGDRAMRELIGARQGRREMTALALKLTFSDAKTGEDRVLSLDGDEYLIMTPDLDQCGGLFSMVLCFKRGNKQRRKSELGEAWALRRHQVLQQPQIRLARMSEAVEGDDRSASEDVRTLEVRYGVNGERLRSFRETVNELQVCEFEDFPFQPRTAMEYVKAVSSISESATAQHHMWLGASRIPDGDRSVYEDEVLARALDLAVTYDSLNVASLACMELICGRRQLISEAHANSPGAPSYMGAEHFMGQTYRQGGGIVVPTLTDFVAKKMQAQSQIMKEKRKAVAKRVFRRRAVIEEVNQSISAMNSLFFGGKGSGHDRLVPSVDSLPTSQKEAIKGIISAVKRMGPKPAGACGSEALQALRAALSSYVPLETGVGDVVPMRLDQLSLPEGTSSGVDMLQALDGDLRDVVENFEDRMLQDADVWTHISRSASRLVPYDDPSLRSRRKYLEFLRELHDRGILCFTEECRGRDGDNLYIAGADIKDCFYAVRLPAGLGLEQFFVLREDVCFEDADWQKVSAELEGLGFSLHEEESASATFKTLGGMVDGAGMSVFRSLYDFIEKNPDGSPKRFLQGREIEERKIFAGPEEWNPRTRALRRDVIGEVDTVLGADPDARLLEQYVEDSDFPEGPGPPGSSQAMEWQRGPGLPRRL